MHFPGSRDHMWSRRTLGKGTFESTTATTDWEGLRHGYQDRFHRGRVGDAAEGRHGRRLLDDDRRPWLLRHVQRVICDGEAPRRRAPELGEHSGARPRRHEGHGLRLALLAGGDRKARRSPRFRTRSRSWRRRHRTSSRLTARSCWRWRTLWGRPPRAARPPRRARSSRSGPRSAHNLESRAGAA